jgi:AcrR family transcriptional regulator
MVMAVAKPGTRRARTRSPRPRLSADDWAQAALVALGEGGLSAVAIERLATRLGTTKGSFYWHFPNRRALIDAALARWEQRRTEAVIAGMEREPDPRQRLRRLFGEGMEAAPTDRTEVALLANADDPMVAPALRRVTQRRIDYLVGLFEQLGLPPADAHRRGLLAYTVYLGVLQLAHAAPGALPTEPNERQRFADSALGALLPPA